MYQCISSSKCYDGSDSATPDSSDDENSEMKWTPFREEGEEEPILPSSTIERLPPLSASIAIPLRPPKLVRQNGGNRTDYARWLNSPNHACYQCFALILCDGPNACEHSVYIMEGVEEEFGTPQKTHYCSKLCLNKIVARSEAVIEFRKNIASLRERPHPIKTNFSIKGNRLIRHSK